MYPVVRRYRNGRCGPSRREERIAWRNAAGTHAAGHSDPGRIRHHSGRISAFLHGAGLERVIEEALAHVDISAIDALQAAGTRIRSAILAAALPRRLVQDIAEGYRRLRIPVRTELRRGGAQQRHRRGSPGGELRRPAGDVSQRPRRAELLDACRRCFASLFTDRAIVYRAHHGFDHTKVACRSASSRWCGPTSAAPA